MQFKIDYQEGKKFAKLSGDNNLIHLDDKEGYNSIFGEKICHGCLVLIKFLKNVEIRNILTKRKKYSLNLIFYKHFSYNKSIRIKKKGNSFIFKQSNNLISELKISFSKNREKKKLIKKKIIKLRNKDRLFNNINDELSLILRNLSKYVGKIYPGKNSIIRQIKINFDKDISFHNDKIIIYSKKIDKRFPIIDNLIEFRNFNIQFQTSFRPLMIYKKTKVNKILRRAINQMKENILIIGASSGIGKELLDIFKLNKKIKIFAGYYKNPINIKNKNIYPIRLNIEKDFNKIFKILNKYKKLKIYYFATPKIKNDLNNKETYNLYKKFYIDYPLKIIKYFKRERLKFFYPSTIFINYNKSSYTKTKKKAENLLKQKENKRVQVNILRIQEINTKQNLSLLQRKLPFFVDLLNKDRNYQTKILFK